MHLLFGNRTTQPLDVIKQSVKQKKPLDASALRASLKLAENCHPVHCNQAYNETVKRLDQARFFQNLKAPTKQTLLNNIKAVLDCDRPTPLKLQKLGEYQMQLEQVRPAECDRLSNLLLAVFDKQFFAEPCTPDSHTKKNAAPNANQAAFTRIIALWGQLGELEKTTLLDRFEQLDTLVSSKSITDKAKICETLMQRLASGPQLLDDDFHKLISVLSQHFHIRAGSTGCQKDLLSQLPVYLNHPTDTLAFLVSQTQRLCANSSKKLIPQDVASVLSNALKTSAQLSFDLVNNTFPLNTLSTTERDILSHFRDNTLTPLLKSIDRQYGAKIVGLKPQLLQCPPDEWQDFAKVAAQLSEDVQQTHATYLPRHTAKAASAPSHESADYPSTLVLAIGPNVAQFSDQYAQLSHTQKQAICAVLARVFSTQSSSQSTLDTAIIQTVFTHHQNAHDEASQNAVADRLAHLLLLKKSDPNNDYNAFCSTGPLKALTQNTASTTQITRTMSDLAAKGRLQPDALTAFLSLPEINRMHMLQALSAANTAPEETVSFVDQLLVHPPQDWMHLAQIHANHKNLGPTLIEHLAKLPKTEWQNFMDFAQSILSNISANASNGTNSTSSIVKTPGYQAGASRAYQETPQTLLPIMLGQYKKTSVSKRTALTPVMQAVDKAFSQVKPRLKLALFYQMAQADVPTEHIQNLIPEMIALQKQKHRTLQGNTAFIKFRQDIDILLSNADSALLLIMKQIAKSCPDADVKKLLPLLLHKTPEVLSQFLDQANRFGRPDLGPFLFVFERVTLEELEPLVTAALQLDCREPESFSQLADLPTEQRRALLDVTTGTALLDAATRKRFDQLPIGQKLTLATLPLSAWPDAFKLLERFEPLLGPLTNATVKSLLQVAASERERFIGFVQSCFAASEPVTLAGALPRTTVRAADAQNRFASRQRTIKALQRIFLQGGSSQHNRVISLIRQSADALRATHTGEPLMVAQHISHPSKPLNHNIHMVAQSIDLLKGSKRADHRTLNNLRLICDALKQTDNSALDTITTQAQRFSEADNFIAIVQVFSSIEVEKLAVYLDCAIQLGDADTILDFFSLFPKVPLSDLPRYAQAAKNIGCTQAAEFELVTNLKKNQLDILEHAGRVQTNLESHRLPYLQTLSILPSSAWVDFADAYRALGALAADIHLRLTELPQENWLHAAQVLGYLYSTHENTATITNLSDAQQVHAIGLATDMLSKLPLQTRELLCPQLNQIAQWTTHFTVDERAALINWLPSDGLADAASIAIFAPSLAAMHSLFDTDLITANGPLRDNRQQADTLSFDNTKDTLRLLARYCPENPAEIIYFAIRLGALNAETLGLVLDQRTPSAQLEFVRDAEALQVRADNMHALIALSQQGPTQRRRLVNALQQLAPLNMSYALYEQLANVAMQDLDVVVETCANLRAVYSRISPSVAIRVMAGLPAGERANFVNLLQHFTSNQLTDSLLETLVDLPAAQRPRYITNRLEGHHVPDARAETEAPMRNMTMQQAYRRDRENVMRGDRITRTKASFRRLIADHTAPSPAEATVIMSEVLQEIKHLKRTGKARDFNADKAIETLSRPRKSRDYTNQLMLNPPYETGGPGLGQMAALVLQLINQYEKPNASAEATAKEREHLTLSYYKAIANCIEEDGHRVCHVGVSQQLLSVLQGYYPQIDIDRVTRIEPSVYFSQLCLEYNRDTELPDIDDNPRRFYEYATNAAQNYYGGTTADKYVEFVEQQLNVFFEASDYAIPGTDDNDSANDESAENHNSTENNFNPENDNIVENNTSAESTEGAGAENAEAERTEAEDSASQGADAQVSEIPSSERPSTTSGNQNNHAVAN